MTRRAVEIAGFLTQSGWDKAQPVPIPADFSSRRFARLDDNGSHAILMDAEGDPKTAEFVAVAEVLRRCDISAPEIFAADIRNGLVLMEDFGEKNIGRLIDDGEKSAPFYRRAVDVLAHLHRTFVPRMIDGLSLPVFDSKLFTAQTGLFLDAYLPFVRDEEATEKERESFSAAWAEALESMDTLPQTLMLRDYMPDNLMDLPDREDWHATGVLDFQDAGYGPIAYDIASLCEVARRDGGDAMLDEMIVYYHVQARPPLALDELRSACRVLAAQRHMRILGIITQHAARTGRQEKLQYLPRIKKYLDSLLHEPNLRPIQKWMDCLHAT